MSLAMVEHRFITISISELIERDTRAVEASVINSAPSVAETEDEVMCETRLTPIRP